MAKKQNPQFICSVCGKVFKEPSYNEAKDKDKTFHICLSEKCRKKAFDMLIQSLKARKSERDATRRNISC